MSLQLTCNKQNCTNPPIPRGKFCNDHRTKGREKCKIEGCQSGAIGKTGHCKAHGGGKRCITPDCKASAQGNTDYCKAHGGGKRCITPDCKASARVQEYRVD